ncbi:MAG TPA: RlpA-like double-psi beta-barrel domain-containing protein [Acetobacteraceae bacterium]|jgi:rare lipoprotein A
MSRAAIVVLPVLLLPGCLQQPAPVPSVHYELGGNYQSGGVWRYPHEDFTLDETGLAEVFGAHGKLTEDGEIFDQGALAAGHPTLQLPALARLTDLDTGRQVLVRVNDRGPASPGRLVEITRRTAELLGARPDTPIRVRLEVQEAESRAMANALRADAPVLNVATASTATVQTETLAPPPGATQAIHMRQAASSPIPHETPPSVPPPPVPLRLPEAVRQVAVRPSVLMIDCGGFSRPEYAEILRAKLAGLGAITTTSYDAPRERAYVVRIGPLSNVAAADTMLARALRVGATDARIVVVQH